MSYFKKKTAVFFAHSVENPEFAESERANPNDSAFANAVDTNTEAAPNP
jgi:hypothetical protein